MSDHRQDYNVLTLLLNGLRMTDDYSEEAAIEDYLSLHPEAQPDAVRAELRAELVKHDKENTGFDLAGTDDWLAEWKNAPTQSAEERFAARIARLERIAKAGNRIGVIDAFALCTDRCVPLPLWVEVGIRELIAAALQPDAGKQRKTVRNWLKQYRGDMRDFGRYELVEEGNKEHGVGFTDADVYRTAAFVARNSDGASWHTFRASHKAVSKTMQSDPFRYAVSVRMRLPERKAATRQRGEDELTSPDELSRLLDIGETRMGKKRAGKLP